MPYAWIDPPNTVRDVCLGEGGIPGVPSEQYVPEIAALYDTLVPDGIGNGATFANGQWTNPPPYVLPNPEPAAPVVPDQITNAQARYVLRRTPYGGGTLFDAVDAAVRAQGGDLVDFWDYANDFYRQSPAILALAAGLNVPSADLDQLFIAAKAVQL